MALSKSSIRFFGCHSKQPENEYDVLKQVEFLDSINSEIIAGDFNFSNKNHYEIFEKNLSDYVIPQLGGKTSSQMQNKSGDISTVRKCRGFK